MTKLSSALLALITLFSAGLVAPAFAADEVVKTLFETRQLDLVSKGSEVTYNFEKKGSDERLVGKDYKDTIKLAVRNVNDRGERDVVVSVFSGVNARDPQSWPELTINPLFVWYLDRAIGTLSSLAGGNQMYYKGRMREAFRDKAKVEPIKFSYKGREIDAEKITLAPFASDPNAKKMQGFENALFTIVVSKDAPGYFLDMSALYESTGAAGPKLEERLALVDMGEGK